MADTTLFESPFAMNDFPYIDPKIQHVGVSKLRNLNATNLSAIDRTLVIQDPNDNPLAVLLKYEQYLAMQKKIQSLFETINILADPQQRKRFQEALDELRGGKLENLEDLTQEQPTKK